MDNGEQNSAIKYFYKSLNFNPEFVEAYYNLGVAFEEKYDYDKAINYYKKALELRPDFIKARYNLAFLYYQKLSLYEEALAELDRLIALSPHYTKAEELRKEVVIDYIEFCLNSGFDYLEEGNFEKAEQEFNKVLLIKPDLVVAKYNLATLYLKRGDKEQAKLSLKEIIRDNPDYPFSYRLLGSIYFDEGNFSEARKYYEEVVKLLPTDVQAYNDLAQTYTKLGEYDKAIGEFLKALSIKPDNLTVLYGLASTYRDKGDYKNALFYYKRLQSISPDYPFVEDDLAGIYATIEETHTAQSPVLEKKEEKRDIVYLKNGRTMQGVILKETEKAVVLKVMLGETEGKVTISRKEILKVEKNNQ